MALEPDLVGFAARLLSDEPLDNEQIKELAALLENRDELFAYLLTHPAFLRKNPDVQAELSRLAREHGHGAATKRQTMGPPAAAQDAVAELQKEILAQISGEKDGANNRSGFDEADRRLVRYTSMDTQREISPERWIRR